jgi:phosphoribosylanthranilate isomerase
VNRVFVKVCGITRLQDAELAAGLGADALGFVFWPGSPRYVAPEAAKAIADSLPRDVMRVGVFVDDAIDKVRKIVDLVGLNAVQLHGAETAAYCRQVAGPTVIKAVGIKDDGAFTIGQFDPDVVLLVDAHDADLYGGTGRTTNWEAAREIAATRRTILAGGLNPSNVTLAVRSVRPYGVDVSSGVESLPGVKDPTRLRSFFEALHG